MYPGFDIVDSLATTFTEAPITFYRHLEKFLVSPIKVYISRMGILGSLLAADPYPFNRWRVAARC